MRECLFQAFCFVKYLMPQVYLKHSLRESWWDIGFEGNGGVKSKETRVCNSKACKMSYSPIFIPS